MLGEQGRTGTFVLGWRYGSERARRPLSHPGQTAPVAERKIIHFVEMAQQ